MKGLLIVNPKAGQGRSPALAQIDEALFAGSIKCDILFTHSPDDARQMAAEAPSKGYDIVIAAGGDGTVSEVANGLAGQDLPLGIVPTGTVNVLAREFGIPLDPVHAARMISEWTPRKIDLGTANGRCFTLMAGFGFDAAVTANVLQPVKDMIGASAYVLKGLETLTRYRATDVTIEMPEHTYRGKAFLVIVANAQTYTYGLKITPRASPHDGVLDVCVFERPISDRLGFAWQVAEVFVNQHLYHSQVKFFRTQSLRISSQPEIMAQLDGDTFGSTPMDVSIRPRSLALVAPWGSCL